MFRHAWHYFDHILLPDGVGAQLLSDPNGTTDQESENQLLDLIEVALHIKRIGAIPLVRYFPVARLQALAAEQSLSLPEPEWSQAWRSVGEAVGATERNQIRYVGQDLFEVQHTDPLLRTGIFLNFTADLENPNRELEMRTAVAEDIVATHQYELERDLACSKLLNAPLGSSLWTHEIVRRKISHEATPSGVLFELSFPSLSNVPISELVKIRVDENDAFVALRGALTRAVLQMQSHQIEDNKLIADKVRSDVLEPELAKLTMRLKAAHRALGKKFALSVSVAGLSTLIGHSFSPEAAALAGGAGLLASGISGALTKQIEEKQAIEAHELFLLWEMLDHAKN